MKTNQAYKVHIANMNVTEEVGSLEEALDFVGGYIEACGDPETDGSGITIDPGALTIQPC